MIQRHYSPRCAECHEKSMAIVDMPYHVKIAHDRREYDVHISAFSVPRCARCGAISVDDVAGQQIDAEFRKTANLLTPEEIRDGRTKLGWQQQTFAECLGIGASTLSRWENGSQVQQRFHDGILRAFFALPQLRSYLAEIHGVLMPVQGIAAIELPSEMTPTPAR